MKRILTMLTWVIFTYVQLGGQADLQWFAINGKGKEGTASALENNYNNMLGGSSHFNLEGIKHPDQSSTLFTKNDLFIIYADGQHFNSRVKPTIDDPGFFYNAGDFSAGRLNHHLATAHSSPVLYFYLTNIYEEDDPPGEVKLKAGGNPGYTNYDLPLLGITNPAVPIFANHDVVRNKNITLILDNAEIDALAGDIDSYFLEYGGIETINPAEDPAVPFNPDYFHLIPIFPGSTSDVAWYPFESANNLSGKINVSLGTPYPYTYVNLRPTTLLLDEDCYPEEDGLPRYRAVFSLKNEKGEIITSMTENLLDSHDPNFISIDSICKDRIKNAIVYYHLEFENTSTLSPSKVHVTFELPKGADKKCIELREWSLGGNKTPGKVKRKGSLVKCFFSDAGTLGTCESETNKRDCIGYIDFKLRIISKYDITDIATPIWVSNPTVYFDGRPYKIGAQLDLTDAVWTDNGFTGEYTRPIKTIPVCKLGCDKF